MTADLSRLIADAFLPDPPKTLGVAVSGGSDSLALLYLLHEVAGQHDVTLRAATVDHGLRPEAADEAKHVAALCHAMDIPHETLKWTGWDHKGNLQAEARTARYDLLSGWGLRCGLDAIALGHTADDQAETFVMRLARQAGVDGLSGMQGRIKYNGVTFIRPLLGAGRDELRADLQARGIDWVDDPSNEDPGFDRVRIRKALALLADVGIDAATLGKVAGNLASARDALEHQMHKAARDLVSLQAGAVAMDAAGFDALPSDLRRRLILHVLWWITGAYYAPRGSALALVLGQISQARTVTLQGCELRRRGGKLWIFRELKPATRASSPIGQPWDNRWRLVAPPDFEGDISSLSVKAFGAQGLAECPDWRDLGLPRGVLLSSPAVWDGARLIAAPLAGRAQNWQAVSERGEDTFFAAHITH